MMETDQTNRPTVEPLIRPANDRVVAGVASAIARRLSIPTWLVRVIFVILVFSGGVGFVAYAAGWLLIPKEGSSRAAAGLLLDRIEGPRAWIGVGLVALAVLVAVESTDLIDADLALAAILITFGVLLYRGDLGLANTSEEEKSMSDTSSSGVRDTAVLETQTGDGPAQPPVPPPVPPVPSAASAPPVPPAPKQRSILGRLTIAAGLIILGIMGLFDVADVADVRARHYFGTAVLVVGIGLLVGSFVGRARGLIILGVILIPPLLFSPLGDVDWSSTSVRYAPATVAEIQESYTADGGDMVIDLSDVDFAGETVAITADMSLGQIQIIVPDDVSVDAQGTVAIGASRVLGDNTAGLGRMTSAGSVEGDNGQLDIDANLDIGEIEIYVEGRRPNGSNDFNVDLGSGGGTVDFEIDTVADLSDTYDVGPGEATFDFSDLVLERAASVDIDGNLGSITIILPDNTVTEVNASVSVGDLQMPNDRESGLDRDATYRTGPDPLLTINVDMGAGEIIVEEMQ
jgi:phage shock protein PspC (stress-responsive transcriptional regulator)/predicted membrane protein